MIWRHYWITWHLVRAAALKSNCYRPLVQMTMCRRELYCLYIVRRFAHCRFTFTKDCSFQPLYIPIDLNKIYFIHFFMKTLDMNERLLGNFHEHFLFSDWLREGTFDLISIFSVKRSNLLLYDASWYAWNGRLCSLKMPCLHDLTTLNTGFLYV